LASQDGLGSIKLVIWCRVRHITGKRHNLYTEKCAVLKYLGVKVAKIKIAIMKK
jgi:hypothetical protein